MRAFIKLTSFFLLGLGLCSFLAQSGDGPRKYPYTAFLACKESMTVFLSKAEYDQLCAQPLCAKDSNQQIVPVQSFDITYAERGLYQDSSGLPIIFTDYTQDKCSGNTLTPKWQGIFKERGYRGDTITYENIKVLGTDQKPHPCQGIKVILK